MKLFIKKAARKSLNILEYLKRRFVWHVLGNKSHGMPVQFAISLGITYACQCVCGHCGMGGYRKNDAKEFTASEWADIIRSFPKKIVDVVVFFGGEPLLRPELTDLIKEAKNQGFMTTLHTNGLLLTPEMVKNIKNAGLNTVEVSIDNIDPKIHDNLRGQQGTLERAIDGIKSCVKEGINCFVDTYATKENIRNGELKKIIDLSRELGAIFVRVLSPISTGRWLEAENIRLNKGERKILKSLLKFNFAFLEDDYCYTKDKKLIYISPYGDVQPCPYVPFAFGNIKNEPLEKIIEKMWNHPIYKIKTKECIMNNDKFRKQYIEKINPNEKLPINL